jgi:hypothetical protein
MTHDDSGRRDGGRRQLEGSMKSARQTERGLELVLRLRNSGDRALHYISDVRGLHYDPATRRLTVRLTDQGRVLIPSVAAKLPRFRVIDPNSDSELTLEVPQKIVKLSDTPAPPGELTLEEQRIADATVIDVDIAWADTPFYQDPRGHDDKRMPAERWQQGQLRVSHQMDSPPQRGPR